MNIKSEILQTVLGVFQLDSAKKAVFREISGFHYLISAIASLIGSLAPQRTDLWRKGIVLVALFELLVWTYRVDLV